MTQVQSIQDLFLYELSDLYDGEQKIAQILPQLANEVDNDQVRQGLLEHERETRQQIQNLERCFQILGSQPQTVTCHVVEGLRQAHQSFAQANPPQALLTLFDLGAEAKTEHLEIAAYRGLVEKARLLGQQECARLLEENLQQEEQMAQRVEQLSRQLGQQHLQQMGQFQS